MINACLHLRKALNQKCLFFQLADSTWQQQATITSNSSSATCLTAFPAPGMYWLCTRSSSQFECILYSVHSTFGLRQQSLWTWVSVNGNASWVGLPKSATSKMQTSGRKTVDLPLRLIEPIERPSHRSHHQREQVSLPPIRKSIWYRTHQPPARYCPIGLPHAV